MAFSVDDKVRVADQHSQYRKMRGFVQSVSDDLHQVRLDGHGCNQVVPLLTRQLKEDTADHPTDYSSCAG